jgi:hypothetical protein
MVKVPVLTELFCGHVLSLLQSPISLEPSGDVRTLKLFVCRGRDCNVKNTVPKPLEGQDEGPSEVQAIVRAIRVGDAIDPIDA